MKTKLNPKNFGITPYATEVVKDTVLNNIFVYHHNNLIATINNSGYSITNAGWVSKTTKDRLNQVLRYCKSNFSIVQKNFQWYLYDHRNKEAKKFSGTLSVINGAARI